MGASSGIGLALAETLASRGVKVGLAARHTATMEELKLKYPEFVEFSSIDVTKPAATDQLLELIGRLGGMDVYIHVAGVGYENVGLDPEREVQIIETNSCGFARMNCAAYRYFRDNGRKGQIAAITSVAGTNGIGHLSAYSSSKKFGQTYLVALEQLAREEKADVIFTDIRPGWVRTPLLLPEARYPMEMTLEYALPLILRAIAKKERVAYIDRRWGMLATAWKRIPNSLWVKMKVNISSPDANFPSRAEIDNEIYNAEEEIAAETTDTLTETAEDKKNGLQN